MFPNRTSLAPFISEIRYTIDITASSEAMSLCWDGCSQSIDPASAGPLRQHQTTAIFAVRLSIRVRRIFTHQECDDSGDIVWLTNPTERNVFSPGYELFVSRRPEWLSRIGNAGMTRFTRICFRPSAKAKLLVSDISAALAAE